MSCNTIVIKRYDVLLSAVSENNDDDDADYKDNDVNDTGNNSIAKQEKAREKRE